MSRIFGNIINPLQDIHTLESKDEDVSASNDVEQEANSILEEVTETSESDQNDKVNDSGEVMLETEFLINQMVEDLDQSSFEKLKEIMTSYDDVDGMKPADFVALWNSLIESKYPEKVHNAIYQQRVWDMCSQIDFDQDGRLTFEEFSGNLVACQRQLISSLPTYDESPEIVHNPSIIPDKLIFSKEYGKILSCGKPEYSAIWDVRDGSLYKQFEGHTATIHHAMYIPYKDLILSTSADRTMIAFDARTLKKKRQIPTKVAQLCLVYDHHTDRIYSGGTDSNIHIWNPEDFTESKFCFKGHTDFVMDLCMLDSLNLLVSCSLDKTLKLWDTRSMKCKHTKHGHMKGVMGLSYSKKFKLLVSYGCEKYAYLWNSLSTSCVFRFEGHTRPLVGAQIVEDTPELITVDTGGVVIIWNIRTYRAVQKLRPPSSIYSKFGAFCYDSFSKKIITSGENEMHYWKSMQADSATSGINHAVIQIRYNRVFKQILTGVKRFLTVWKSVNGHLHKQFPVSDSNITDFIILSQWRAAAVSTVDGEVKVISLMDGSVSKSISLKDEIRGLFLIDKEIHGEESDHILVPSLKGVVYYIDLGKEQILDVYKSSLKNCTISGSAHSSKYNLLATISGDFIEIWKTLHPDYPHNHIEVKDDVTMCCFVDAWNCFITLSTCETLRIYSVPSFRHLCTIRFELPFPSPVTSTVQKMQIPTPLSFVHFHASTGSLIVTSTYHISVLNVKQLISQCVAEIERNSILSKEQTILYRNRFIVAWKSSTMEDQRNSIFRAFDTKHKRLCQLQFFQSKDFFLESIIENEVIKSSQFIAHHYEVINPSEDSSPIQAAGCIVMEDYSTTLEKLLRFQDLNIDELRWLTYCVVSAIQTLHSQNIVVNNLSKRNIVRVDKGWKIINLQSCKEVGESFPKDSLPAYNYSPEYAKQAVEDEFITANFSHDIWCLAHILLLLTMDTVIVDKSMDVQTIINTLLYIKASGPAVPLSSNIIDITLRNVVKNALLKNEGQRWDITKIVRSLETAGVFVEPPTPQKQRQSAELDDDSDSEDEEECPYQFPSLWENQPYNSFTAHYDNPGILMSNISVCNANEGVITSTCIVNDPPLILTSTYRKSYHQGRIYIYDLIGNLRGTLPTDGDGATQPWKWPEVNEADLYYTFEVPEDAPELAIDEETTIMKSEVSKPKLNIRSLWNDSDSDAEDAIREILEEKDGRNTPTSERMSTPTKQMKHNVTPKIKVSFNGRRKNGKFDRKLI